MNLHSIPVEYWQKRAKRYYKDFFVHGITNYYRTYTSINDCKRIK